MKIIQEVQLEYRSKIPQRRFCRESKLSEILKTILATRTFRDVTGGRYREPEEMFVQFHEEKNCEAS